MRYKNRNEQNSVTRFLDENEEEERQGGAMGIPRVIPWAAPRA